MILRRITKHVRDQNWFAVVLDFFIVVVGVFIGIQVANWNEERKEQQQQHQYRLSFKSDIQSEITEVQSRIAYQRRQAERIRFVRSFLVQDAKPTKETAQEMIIALHLATYKWVTSVTDITVNEMISNGKLHLLGDLSFRKEVQSFYNRYGTGQNSRGNIDDYRVLIRSIIPPELQQAITSACNNFEYDRIQIEERFGRCNIDFSHFDAQEIMREMKSRPDFKYVLTYRQSFLTSEVGWATSMLTQLNKMSDQLDTQNKALN